MRVFDGGGIVLDGSRCPILGDEHHFIIRKVDLSFTDNSGHGECVSSPGGFLDCPEDLSQWATHRLMQTPSSKTCGDRIQGNHSPLGTGRDHTVSDAGQGDLKPFSLCLLSLGCPLQLGVGGHGTFTGCSQGTAKHSDGQANGKESKSQLGLGRRIHEG